MTALKIEWVDRGIEPQSPPNPNFPNGVDADLRSNRNAPSCKTDLPYPARRCGQYVIYCGKCGLRVMVTTAGRRDDPRSVLMNCKLH
jgi:hypothetical protein